MTAAAPRLARATLGLATAAAIAGLAAGCATRCPQVDARLPSTPLALPSGLATGTVRLEGGRSLELRVDTGFERTALLATSAQGLDLTRLTLSSGELRLGPISADLLDLPQAPFDGVLGSDALSQLPWSWTADGGFVVAPAFSEEAATPVETLAEADCRGDRPSHAGPLYFLAVGAGQETSTWLLDTGAELSMASQALLASLPGDRLEGVSIATGFGGMLVARAARAGSLELAGRSRPNPAVLASPRIDDELARLSARLGHPVTGMLGWNVLSAFALHLDRRSGGRPQLLLLPGPAPARELVGYGVQVSPSSTPPGLRIVGFLSNSPAREAGLQIDDVVTAVSGALPGHALPVPVPPGGSARLAVHRGTSVFEVDVEVRDLLPDP